MDFLYRKPRKELAPYITGFVNLEEHGNGSKRIPLYPNNCSYLTYNYLNAPSFFDGKQTYKLPKLFISGQVMASDLHLRIGDTIGHLGIEFKPSGFYKLFQTDMSEILNTFSRLSEIEPAHDSLLNKLEGRQDFEGRCDILENYLLEKLSHAVSTDRIDRSVEIFKKDPAIKIKDLCKTIAVSERQLRRDFLKIVGVPPKVYAKIQQLKQVFLMIKEDKKELLKEYAYSCGYYDVAHFINAFQNDIGQDPSGFIEGYDDYLSFYLSNRRS